jgi:hypothetical protein
MCRLQSADRYRQVAQIRTETRRHPSIECGHPGHADHRLCRPVSPAGCLPTFQAAAGSRSGPNGRTGNIPIWQSGWVGSRRARWPCRRNPTAARDARRRHPWHTPPTADARMIRHPKVLAYAPRPLVGAFIIAADSANEPGLEVTCHRATKSRI